MKEWQFDVLFCVAVFGTLFILVAPAVGLNEVPKNPGAIGGIGVILTYVLTQRDSITKKNGNDSTKSKATEKKEETK